MLLKLFLSPHLKYIYLKAALTKIITPNNYHHYSKTFLTFASNDIIR